MLKQVQELQKYLKDKKIPSSGAKKDLVHRVKMHQDSISRQRGGLGEGGMSSKGRAFLRPAERIVRIATSRGA